MNESQRIKWEQTRSKGFWRYVLLYWVLWWSTAMIVGTTVLDYFTGTRGFRFEDLRTKVPIYLIAGFAAGTAAWLYAEYRYKKTR